MAAMEITDVQRELINSLTSDELPMKLRCAVCSKLALNAFRLPCCEQAICENCQSTLPISCPICEHSPLTADDCNPHKSLRTTIRVFLRTAEKKREAAKPKNVPEPDPEPEVATQTTAPTPAEAEHSIQSANLNEPQGDHQEEAIQKSQSDMPPPDGESRISATNELSDNDTAPHTTTEVANAGDHDENSQQVQRADKQDEHVQEGGEGFQNQGFQAGGDSNGFQNANPSGGVGDYSQMQMMMAMQNGMGFPMMGMNMDPMTMQQMYMNGGFQGMGMNGMGGFGSGFGQGSNDWNGAQSWNFDQSNYNQSGDFGNMNPGFQSGYNQGGYGNHYNSYGRGFGRGRGRGRGFHGAYGRGGYNYGNRMNYQQDQYQNGMNQQQFQGTDPQAQQDGASKDTDEFGRSVSQTAGESGDATAATENQAQNPQGEAMPGDVAQNIPQGPGAIQSVLSVSEPPEAPFNAPTGPKAMRQGLPNTSLHHLRARGFQIGGTSSNEAQQEGAHPLQTEYSESASPRRGRDYDDGASRSRSRDRVSKRRADSIDRSQEASRTRSRSLSRASSRNTDRSRRRNHKSSHSRRRDLEEDDYDTEEYHRRKKHRSSRKHSSRYEDDDENSGSKEDHRYADRSRSASPAESRRSGHRSRRDKDYEKRRDYEDDRRKSSHRSSRRHRDDDSGRRHRDRDSDRDRTSQRERGTDREREDRRRERKERHRERDRDYKHSSSSSRKHSVDERPTPADQTLPRDKAGRPPTGPRGFDIKGSASSSRRTNDDTSTAATTGFIMAEKPSSLDRKVSASNDMTSAFPNRASKDPHAMEREARNRERLLRETMRMALAGTKRSRDGKDDGGTGDETRRRRGRRSEAEAD